MRSAAKIFYLAVFALFGPAQVASHDGSAESCAVSDHFFSFVIICILTICSL